MERLYHQNAFRILDIPSNSTLPEILNSYQALINRNGIIEPNHDLLPFLPPPDRSNNSIVEAFNKLQNSNDHLMNKLFWFDKESICLLREKGINTAKYIWRNENSIASKVNLARLYHAFCIARLPRGLKPDYWRKTFKIWSEVLNEEFWDEFRNTAELEILDEEFETFKQTCHDYIIIWPKWYAIKNISDDFREKIVLIIDSDDLPLKEKGLESRRIYRYYKNQLIKQINIVSDYYENAQKFIDSAKTKLLNQNHNIIKERLFNYIRRSFNGKHQNLLELKKCIRRPHYQPIGAAPPINDIESLNNYITNGHFHKNFYTNYHALNALWNWFDFHSFQYNNFDLFNIYDISSGPFTASISFLNFLHNNGIDISSKHFKLHFCDLGLWLFEHLQTHITDHLSFPIPLKIFHNCICGHIPPCPFEILNEFINNEFRELYNFNFYKKNCSDEELNCSLHFDMITESHIDEESCNAINMIFLSYSGPNHTYNFEQCLLRIIKNFSEKQRNFPTYIIYSHYLMARNPANRNIVIDRYINFMQENGINIRCIMDDGSEPIPFNNNNYFYAIFKIRGRK